MELVSNGELNCMNGKNIEHNTEGRNRVCCNERKLPGTETENLPALPAGQAGGRQTEHGLFQTKNEQRRTNNELPFYFCLLPDSKPETDSHTSRWNKECRTENGCEPCTEYYTSVPECLFTKRKNQMAHYLAFIQIRVG